MRLKEDKEKKILQILKTFCETRLDPEEDTTIEIIIASNVLEIRYHGYKSEIHNI